MIRRGFSSSSHDNNGEEDKIFPIVITSGPKEKNKQLDYYYGRVSADSYDSSVFFFIQFENKSMLRMMMLKTGVVVTVWKV